MKLSRFITPLFVIGFASSVFLGNPTTTCFAFSGTQLKETANDFTAVAKMAIPAVVSVQVKSTDKQRSALGQSDQDNPEDQFSDPFWQKFFGMPFRNNVPSEPTQGQASGFIVSSDGYIVTNGHVVDQFNEINVVLNDGREFPAKVIGQDNNTDIAVIKIDAKDLPFLKFGDSNDLEVGQWVVAIGTPLGLQASLTVGVVSAKGRNNLDIARIEDFIQTDAAINRGNSGGPLLNLQGDVVGVNTAIASNLGGFMGIGFSIPSSIAQNVMEQLLAKGTVSRGYIGVILQKVDKDLAAAFGLDKPEGALIAQVAKESPAEKAGIKQGDVIVKYNNISVTNIGALRNAVALMKPGANLNLSILREGKPKELAVVIGDFSATQPEKASIQENKLGITVENITPELAQKLGANAEKGVIVSKVEQGSIAQWVGLRKGMQILAVNQKKIENVQQFLDTLQDSDKSKPILLLIKEADSVRFVSFKVN